MEVNELISTVKKKIEKKILAQNIVIKDKKNSNNKINLVLLSKIGKAIYNYQFKVPAIYKFLNKELIN